MKRRITVLITLLLLFTSLTSACAQSALQNTSATDAVIITKAETMSNVDSRKAIDDELPATDFKGQIFRACIPTDKEYEIYTEKLDGDVCNDVVYNRNIQIETRFNCKIETIPLTDSGTVISALAKSVNSGSCDFELAGYNNYESYRPINAKNLMNWLDVPYFNSDKPWHNALANNNATIKGKLFSACSDLSITSMTYTFAIFFNTRLAENYGMTTDSLYGEVFDGTWTIDRFITLTKDIYEDVNGDGKPDANDMYGFGYEMTNPADVWLTAFDQPLTSVNENGEIEITFMTDKTVAALAKIVDFQYSSAGCFKYTTQYDEEKYFKNGTVVFTPLRFYMAYSTLRAMEDVYSVLPYPKWDEKQEAYYTNADDKFTAYGVPLTVTDTNFIGVVYEALCAQSYKDVYPVYYDVALKGKYTSDSTMAAIIDLIMSGKNFDFSFQFGEVNFQRLPYLFRDQLRAKNTDIASKYASIEKALNTGIQKLYEVYN